VKLLFDENLSPKLPEMLAAEYTGSAHVRTLDLVGASDEAIWNRARDNGFIIVSKDTDFRERSIMEGSPPKVIWLDVGNAGTKLIADLLRRDISVVKLFDQQDESSFLILSPSRDSV